MATRTAVIGAGKMGRLHSRVYSQMEGVELIGIVDQDQAKAEELAKEYGSTACGSLEPLLDQVDAVTVAVPTEQHAQVARPFLERGLAVLIEKPLAASLEEARDLLALAEKNDCTLQVGYSERFNPVVQAMKRLNFQPRFIEAVRISPFTFRSTDISVVLDMMIHDIDIVLSMARSPIKSVQAVGVNVLAEHEDVANARITFESGCVANLTASRLAMKTDRKIRVFSEEAYLSLDNLAKTGLMISLAANRDMVQQLRQMLDEKGSFDPRSLNWTELVQMENLDIDEREPLMLEQEAFIKAVSQKSRPEVSASDAIAAMELAERICTEIAEHRWEGLNPADVGVAHS